MVICEPSYRNLAVLKEVRVSGGGFLLQEVLLSGCSAAFQPHNLFKCYEFWYFLEYLKGKR
jgi:hypothetical protein